METKTNFTYCPNCGEYYRNLSMLPFYTGHTCDRCLKTIPSLEEFEEKIIEQLKSSIDKRDMELSQLRASNVLAEALETLGLPQAVKLFKDSFPFID